MPSKKTKNLEPEPEPVPDPEEEDEDEDDEEEEEEEEEEEANADEEEEDAPDEEDDAERAKRLKRSNVNHRRKARQNGVRQFAVASGCAVGNDSFGNDIIKTILSPSDVARLARWCPANAADSFVSLPQFTTQLELRDESLSSGPLRVLTAHVESVARKVVGDAVLRNLESNGPATVTAANLKSALRPIADALHVDDMIMPRGVVRSAQQTHRGSVKDVDGKKVYVESDKTILPKKENTDATIVEERKFAKQNHSKLMRETDKTQQAKRDARKRKRSTNEAAVGPPAMSTATV